MRIIIDAMSGDNAPREIVKGAVDAQKEFGVDITLTGKTEEIASLLKEFGAEGNEHLKIVDAPDIIDMEDDPATAVRRKPESSMAVALKLVRDGEGDACLSAGNTGALLTGATLVAKRIKGIRRAAMAPVLPNDGKGVVLIDCGANADCTEEYLLQFAYMGSFYSERMLGVERPKVGLLNIGSEDTKGTELRKSTFKLLQKAGESGRINFIGNIEGTDVFTGKVDVIVTDGFTGNVLLKTIEGTVKFMLKLTKRAFKANPATMVGAALTKGKLKEELSIMDASEIGGTPFLGISVPVIKAHGSSNARAIRSAVKQAIAFAEAGITTAISENIEYMTIKEDNEG